MVKKFFTSAGAMILEGVAVTLLFEGLSEAIGGEDAITVFDSDFSDGVTDFSKSAAEATVGVAIFAGAFSLLSKSSRYRLGWKKLSVLKSGIYSHVKGASTLGGRKLGGRVVLDSKGDVSRVTLYVIDSVTMKRKVFGTVKVPKGVRGRPSAYYVGGAVASLTAASTPWINDLVRYLVDGDVHNFKSTFYNKLDLDVLDAETNKWLTSDTQEKVWDVSKEDFKSGSFDHDLYVMFNNRAYAPADLYDAIISTHDWYSRRDGSLTSWLVSNGVAPDDRFRTGFRLLMILEELLSFDDFDDNKDRIIELCTKYDDICMIIENSRMLNTNLNDSPLGSKGRKKLSTGSAGGSSVKKKVPDDTSYDPLGSYFSS